MQLKDYLTKYRINCEVFAVHAGIASATIYGILRGRIPRQNTAEAIERESDGLVTVMELRGADARLKKKSQ